MSNENPWLALTGHVVAIFQGVAREPVRPSATLHATYGPKDMA